MTNDTQYPGYGMECIFCCLNFLTANAGCGQRRFFEAFLAAAFLIEDDDMMMDLKRGPTT